MNESASKGATQALVTRPGEVAYHRFRIEVVSGPDRGATALAGGRELTIGVDEGNDLRLADTTVSRHHCTIAATTAGFRLQDLGSTNGTTIDGVRVEVAYLSSGSIIGVGQTSLRFVCDGDDEIREPLSDDDEFGGALGRSPAMRRIFALLPRIATSSSTVLLEGETGTGKGLLADAIHRASARADGPFVVIDCSAIPPTLIESELFGHEKGAFTGAHAARAGAFESASGGTLFLDELGELPLDMQPKLLRALEDRSVKRVGSNELTKVDVRVIAATNRDLRQEVNKGSFRSDLFYRLNTIRLHIPPLRERRDDIPMLVEHFYSQFSDSSEPPPADLLARLYRQSWPGNVRELRSAVERAVLMGDLDGWNDSNPALVVETEPTDAAPVVHEAFEPSISFRNAKERAVGRWESWYLNELVARHDGNLSRAARAARMDRNHLRELLRRYGLAER